MFGFTLANFVVIIPYILAFFTMFNIELTSEVADAAAIGSVSEISAIMRNVLILSGFLAGAILWWAGLTSVINLFRRRFRPRHMLTINHGAGVIIGVLGLYTLLSVLI